MFADNMPVQVRQRALYFKLSRFAAMPDVVGKPLFGRQAGQPGKMFGNILMFVRQRIDAEAAVSDRIGMIRALRLMHSITVGGSSVTGATAVIVMP